MAKKVEIRECPICGKLCKGSSGLGGHMGKHNNENKEARKEKNRLRMKKVREKRLRQAASPIVIKNPAPAPRPTEVMEINSLSQWSTKSDKVGRASVAALHMRQAAADYRRKADELDKMAERAQQLM